VNIFLNIFLYLSLLLLLGFGVVLLVQFTGINFIQNDNNKTFDGLWIPQNLTQIQVIDYVHDEVEAGPWVCINIKGMSFNRCVEVAKHECGHNLFAQVCEKNMSKCEEVMND